jgi:hypothetical protein
VDSGAGAVGAADGGSAAAVSLDGDGGGGGGGGHPSGGPPEQLSPGYGAGYDAGFQAGLLAASQGDAPTGSVQGSAAAEEGPSAPGRPPFLALLEDFPDLFRKEVLDRLDPVDRALLGRTGSAVRTAVKRSGLPRVGGSADEPRVGIAAFCQSPPDVRLGRGERLPVGVYEHFWTCGDFGGHSRWGRAPGSAAVGAGARLPVG